MDLLVIYGYHMDGESKLVAFYKLKFILGKHLIRCFPTTYSVVLTITYIYIGSLHIYV